MRHWLASFFLIAITSCGFAAPQTVYIIRHADKLSQAEPGPSLSAKGELRAIKFAYYFLNQFGEPDFLIAAAANHNTGNSSSQRTLETLAPLANILAERHPETDIPILHSYISDDYDKLVKHLLEDKKYDGKKVLICWHHGSINKMINGFGYKDNLPEWDNNDFDSVYVLHLSKSGNVKQLEHLEHQYPLEFNGSWQELLNKVSG